MQAATADYRDFPRGLKHQAAEERVVPQAEQQVQMVLLAQLEIDTMPVQAVVEAGEERAQVLARKPSADAAATAEHPEAAVAGVVQHTTAQQQQTFKSAPAATVLGVNAPSKNLVDQFLLVIATNESRIVGVNFSFSLRYLSHDKVHLA